MIRAEVVADSVSHTTGERLVSFTATYPRFIHSELLTHRVFSRNAASSRAIPTKRVRDTVLHNPVMPSHYGANIAGMSARRQLPLPKRQEAIRLIMELAGNALNTHERLEAIGLHKQVANRYLEPWSPMTSLVTTRLNGLTHLGYLRLSPKAQPEFDLLTDEIFKAVLASSPATLRTGELHSPFMCQHVEDLLKSPDSQFNSTPLLNLEAAHRILAGRCARVSYLTHNGKRDLFDDLRLGCDLLSDLHMSPFEHIATVGDAGPCSPTGNLSGNLHCYGWVQLRKTISQEFFTTSNFLELALSRLERRAEERKLEYSAAEEQP